MALDGKRSWLRALIITEGFHKPCLKCASLKKPSRDVTVHYFDLEAQKGLCGVCRAESTVKGHRQLQIRRSSYHGNPPMASDKRPNGKPGALFRWAAMQICCETIRHCKAGRRRRCANICHQLAEGAVHPMQYTNCGGCCRPQTRAPKCPTGASQCLICERQLADTNMRYCSIECKLDSAAGVLPLEEWHFATSSSHSNGSSSHIYTPPVLDSSGTRQGSNSSSTSVECCSNRPLKRRKKCRNPQRAPAE